MSIAQSTKPPIVWTIAGSDSGGGAGIQADLLTFNHLGVHGCSVLTALTAQNSTTVSQIETVSADFLAKQLAVLSSDLPAAAIKLGLLGDADLMQVVADYLQDFPGQVVLDPVMVATSGSVLLPEPAKQCLIDKLFPLVDIVTPNLAETQALIGQPLRNDADVQQAARVLHELGAATVVIKDGHGCGPYAADFVSYEAHHYFLKTPRQSANNNHGSGCSFAAAIAAGLAKGLHITDALVLAKAYVSQGIRHAARYGAGAGPVAHLGYPDNADDLPWVDNSDDGAAPRPSGFSPCAKVQDCYPLVSDLLSAQRLLNAGAKVLQFRNKKINDAELNQVLPGVIALAKAHDAVVYVNDHWRLAIAHQAHGVHLGQSDLHQADVNAIRAAGLHLGLTIGNWHEAAIAHYYQPSYVGIGPVYPSRNKEADPIGEAMFADLARVMSCPVVAIGGIDATRAAKLLANGADGIAVIDALSGDQPQAMLQILTALCQQHAVQHSNEPLLLGLVQQLDVLRHNKPLVHNITNYVVMQQTANALLAAGASPIMAHAPEELAELINIISSLVVNIGTLDQTWVASMTMAIDAIKAKNKPWVLDPVGVGASTYRTQVARDLLAQHAPTVIRGNASEIMALAGEDIVTKGVDSCCSTDHAVAAAQHLATQHQTVVVISGETDYVISATNMVSINNGHALMAQVTGMGCTATALIGACCAVVDDPWQAAILAMLLMGIAGEEAAACATGPGSFVPHFLDMLASITPAQLQQYALLEVIKGDTV